MSEVWRVCPGYSAYEVSDFGRVRRLKPGAKGRYGNGSLRKPYEDRVNGRFTLWMDCDDGERRNVGVNRLVLLTFVGPPPTSRHEGAHWDGSPSNNALGNLRWATPSENQMDRVRHGTSNRGTRQHMARLDEGAVRAIRKRMASGEMQKLVAASFGVSRGAIAAITQGRSWYWLDEAA